MRTAVEEGSGYFPQSDQPGKQVMLLKAPKKPPAYTQRAIYSLKLHLDQCQRTIHLGFLAPPTREAAKECLKQTKCDKVLKKNFAALIDLWNPKKKGPQSLSYANKVIGSISVTEGRVFVEANFG